MKSFAELFKKYRLRAEFETFAAFGDALAEKGLLYEESIFSHWQKGSRVPSNRHLLLKILEIFVERGAVTTIDEANEFFSSAQQGFLTDTEVKELHLTRFHSAFQVPSEVGHFTGRKDVIQKIEKEILQKKVFLLYGTAGVGKTALAIRLGHILREMFPDGVLWYKVDSSNVMDILLSISYLFGEDISMIKDPEVRATIVRSLLEKKRVLLIFDNVTNKDRLSLLLPNTSSCCVIFTSQEMVLDGVSEHEAISMQAFQPKEVLELYKNIFDEKYVIKYKQSILSIGDKLGYLPLAVHVAAHIVLTSSQSPDEFLKSYFDRADGDSIDLQKFTYEDKNLFRAIGIGFSTLESQTKDVFVSLAVFEAKDFSLDAVAFVNKLSLRKTEHILEHLRQISFIEKSDDGRYRIHPLMRLYAKKQLQDSSIYARSAAYYERLHLEAEERNSYQFTDLTSKQQDTLFEHFRVIASNLASYIANIYNNPSVFQSSVYWQFENRVIKKDGKFLNNKDDVSTFHIPSFVVLDAKEKKDIELTASLDFIVPSILESNPSIAAMYTIDNKGVTRYFPNIVLGSLASPDYDPRPDIYYKVATPEENPEKKVVWTPLYEDVAGRGLMITASAPIYTKNGFQGVAGVDILLKDIIKTITEYRLLSDSRLK